MRRETSRDIERHQETWTTGGRKRTKHSYKTQTEGSEEASRVRKIKCQRESLGEVLLTRLERRQRNPREALRHLPHRSVQRSTPSVTSYQEHMKMQDHVNVDLTEKQNKLEEKIVWQCFLPCCDTKSLWREEVKAADSEKESDSGDDNLAEVFR